MRDDIRPDYRARISLMEAIGFTSDEIRTNRTGLISERQRVVLRELVFYSRLMGWVVAAITLVPSVLLIWDGIRFHETLMSRIEILFPTLLIGGILYIETYRHTQRAQRDLVSGHVSTYTGRVEFRNRRTYGGGGVYQLTFAGLDFKVTHWVFEAFEAGRIYSIYYAPHTKRLLSAELLD